MQLVITPNKFFLDAELAIIHSHYSKLLLKCFIDCGMYYHSKINIKEFINYNFIRLGVVPATPEANYKYYVNNEWFNTAARSVTAVKKFYELFKEAIDVGFNKNMFTDTDIKHYNYLTSSEIVTLFTSTPWD